jgi:hypothetical protein
MYNLKKSNSEQQGVEGGCQGLGGESHGEMSVKRYTVPVRTKFSQASVAHTCNPSYSGGRDQGNRGLKSAWANSWRDRISKKPITEKSWWSDSRCRLEFKPKYHKKK